MLHDMRTRTEILLYVVWINVATGEISKRRAMALLFILTFYFAAGSLISALNKSPSTPMENLPCMRPTRL